jgi:hypothetical protein
VPAPPQPPPSGRVSCQACGASWPDDGTAALLRTCPACTATDPNAGGSPARPEAEDDALIDAAARSTAVPAAGPAGARTGDDGGPGVRDGGPAGRKAATDRPGPGTAT